MFLLGVVGVGSKNGKGANVGPRAGAFGKGALVGLNKLGGMPVGSKALGDGACTGVGAQPGGRGIPGLVGLQSRASRLHRGCVEGNMTIRHESKVL